MGSANRAGEEKKNDKSKTRAASNRGVWSERIKDKNQTHRAPDSDFSHQHFVSYVSRITEATSVTWCITHVSRLHSSSTHSTRPSPSSSTWYVFYLLHCTFHSSFSWYRQWCFWGRREGSGSGLPPNLYLQVRRAVGGIGRSSLSSRSTPGAGRQTQKTSRGPFSVHA